MVVACGSSLTKIRLVFELSAITNRLFSLFSLSIGSSSFANPSQVSKTRTGGFRFVRKSRIDFNRLLTVLSLTSANESERMVSGIQGRWLRSFLSDTREER